MARVVETLDPHTVILEIANKLIQAKTEVPLFNGQQLSLRILNAGATLVLQIMPQITAQQTEALQRMQALLNVLPQQQSLEKLVQDVFAMLKALDTTQATPQLKALNDATQQFTQQAVPAHQLTTAKGVQDAVRNSGIFLEHRLAQALSSTATETPATISTTDFKAALLRLVQQLQPSPPTTPATTPTSSPKNALAMAPEASTTAAEAAPEAVTPHLTTRPATAPPAPIEPLPPKASALAPTTPATNPAPAATATQTAPASATPTRDIPVVIVGPTTTPETTDAVARTTTSKDRAFPSGATAKATITNDTPLPTHQAGGVVPAPRTQVPPVIAASANQSTTPINTNAPRATADAFVDTPPKNAKMPTPDTKKLKPHTRATHDEAIFTAVTKSAEGALARQQVHQLAALTAHQNQQTVWTFELPVQLSQQLHTLRMRIEEDTTRRDAQGRAPFCVTLATDIEPLGPLSARISLLDKNVSVVFYAERAPTLVKAQTELAKLRGALAANGLEVQHLHCLAGSVADQTDPPLPMGKSMLDIKA